MSVYKNIYRASILTLLLCFGMVAFAHDFQGRHVIGELYGVDAKLLDDAELLEQTLKDGIKLSNATFVQSINEKFEPHGVTILILVAESHVSIHTYPEHNTLFFDAFTCGNCKPEAIAEELIRVLKPSKHKLEIIERGL